MVTRLLCLCRKVRHSGYFIKSGVVHLSFSQRVFVSVIPLYIIGDYYRVYNRSGHTRSTLV